jgi:hypothetical protein
MPQRNRTSYDLGENFTRPATCCRVLVSFTVSTPNAATPDAATGDIPPRLLQPGAGLRLNSGG